MGSSKSHPTEPPRSSKRRIPPTDLDSREEFILALRALVDRRGISQRELVQRDETGLLRPATLSAVLRMQRSARRDVTIAIVRACGVPDPAVDHWAAAWDHLVRPNWLAAKQQQRLIAHSWGKAQSHRWGGASW
ncbi:MAG: helix-turn-helix domain-containing protein [Pseudonocardiaceae bacterium]